MTDMGQHLNETDLARYEPPSIEVLGSIADLTAGGTGGAHDACNAAAFAISEFHQQQGPF